MSVRLSYLLSVSFFLILCVASCRTATSDNQVEVKEKVMSIIQNGSLESVYLVDALSDAIENTDGVGYKVIEKLVLFDPAVQERLKRELISTDSFHLDSDDVASFSAFLPDVILFIKDNQDTVRIDIAFESHDIVFSVGKSELSYIINEGSKSGLLDIIASLFPANVYLKSLCDRYEGEKKAIR